MLTGSLSPYKQMNTDPFYFTAQGSSLGNKNTVNKSKCIQEQWAEYDKETDKGTG